MKGRLARAAAQEKGEKLSKKDFWRIEEPTLFEKLAMELATELEKQRDPEYVSVSVESQDAAIDYFNEHGFVDTLTHMLSLRDAPKRTTTPEGEVWGPPILEGFAKFYHGAGALAPAPTGAKRECEAKTEFCSGELMARWTGTKKDDPVFWCCGACLVILRRRGLKLRQVQE